MSPVWDEIVSAYDANLEVLESARAAYDKAVRAIVNELKTNLAARPFEPGHGLDVIGPTVSQEPNQFAKWVCSCEVQANKVSWASVRVRPAAPWTGEEWGKLEARVDIVVLTELHHLRGGIRESAREAIRAEFECDWAFLDADSQNHETCGARRLLPLANGEVVALAADTV